jgi:hypothetical protein
VSIDLPLGASRIATTGEVRHVKTQKTRLGTVYMHGVAFGELAMEAKDAIEAYCTNHSMALWRLRYRQSIDIVTRAGEVMRNLRGGRRRLVGLPAIVQMNGPSTSVPEATRTLVLEEMGSGGARLIGDSPIPPGTPISFTVPGSVLAGAGVVRHVQTLQTSVAILFSMGVEFNPATSRERTTLGRFSPFALLAGATGGVKHPS